MTILDGLLRGLGWILAGALIAGLMLLIGRPVMQHYDKEARDDRGE